MFFEELRCMFLFLVDVCGGSCASASHFVFSYQWSSFVVPIVADHRDIGSNGLTSLPAGVFSPVVNLVEL